MKKKEEKMLMAGLCGVMAKIGHPDKQNGEMPYPIVLNKGAAEVLVQAFGAELLDRLVVKAVEMGFRSLAYEFGLTEFSSQAELREYLDRIVQQEKERRQSD